LLLERRHDVELFEAALATMDLDQRAVFTLFELEGVRGPEVAEALEIPLGTAYSRLRLAREAFRRAVMRSVSQRQSRVRLGRVP
jgi:RNA polymerase sigma-70 factor (ECF subfamily)